MCLVEKIINSGKGLFLTLFLFLMSNSIQAQDLVYLVNINFSDNYNVQGWNNTDSIPYNGLSLDELVTSQGDTISVSLMLNSEWGGLHLLGTQTSDNSGIVPDSVLREYYWTGPYGGQQSSSLVLSGLSDSLLYTIEIIGSSSFSLASGSQSLYSIGNISKKLTTYFNASNSVVFDDIVVDGTGEVEIDVSVVPGGEIAMINALIIRAYYKDLLAPPLNLSGVYRGGNVMLNWKDKSIVEEQFEVFRREPNGTFELIGSASQNVSEFSDENVSIGDVFEYKVRAKSAEDDYSLFSNTQKIHIAEVYDSLLVNFGNRRSVTSWNNFMQLPENGIGKSNLISATGKKTNVCVFLGPDWQGVSDDGAITGDNSGIIPDNALLEYYYFGLEDTLQRPKLIISGLVPGDRYNVRFVASSKYKQVADNGTTIYSIGDDTTKLYVQNNSENSALISGIVADDNGLVVVNLFKDVSTPVGYLNALIIESFSPLEEYDANSHLEDILIIGGYKSMVTLNEQGDNFKTHLSAESGDYYYGAFEESEGIIYGVIRNKTASDKIYAYNIQNGEYYILKTFDANTQLNQITYNEGYLYGTTKQLNNPQISNVFRITTEGDDFENLADFNASLDGSLPVGQLVVLNGFLFGVNFSGGLNNLGSIFKINLEDSSMDIFHHFDGSKGAWPAVGLTIGNDGYLYGISQSLNAPYSYLLKIGDDNSIVKLDSISEEEGFNISGSLVSEGDFLYGISKSGGDYGFGTVFKYNIILDEFSLLHSFSFEDAGSNSSLYINENGVIFGVSGFSDVAGGRLFTIDNSGYFKLLKNIDWQGPAFNLQILPSSFEPAPKITETKAPVNLLATNNLNGTISLSWEDRSVNETGFEISRREYGEQYVVLDTVAENTISYADNVVQSKVYEYQVRALAKVGNSPYVGPRRIMTHSIANSIKVNFGLNHAVTDPTWNNLLAIPKSGIKSTLLNTATQGRTDVRVELTSNWGGVQPQGSITGDDSGVVPDKALQEYYWFGGFGAPLTTSITITGLPANSLFNLLFTGSSQFPGVQDNGSTVYSIDNQSISLNVQNNVSKQAVLSGIYSDSEGKLQITLSKGTNSPLGYINAMILQSVQPLGAVALAPGSLKGFFEEGKLFLEWQDTNKTEYGFEISRKESENAFVAIDTVGANITVYEDLTIETDKIYKYKVKTLSQFGNSPSSNEVKITTHSISDTIRVNFGFRHKIESAGWNNMLAPPQNGLELNNLVTTMDKVTNVNIKLTSDWGGVEASGTTTGNNSGIIPDEGLKEYYWFGIFGAPNTTSIKISGLISNGLYNIRFIASSQFASFADNGSTIFIVGQDSITLHVQQNTLNDAFIGGISSDINGAIDIKLIKANGTPVGYINALILEAVNALEEAEIPLGLDRDHIEIYPNPSKDHFLIKDVEFAVREASLMSLTGKVIMKNLPLNRQIDVGTLKEGVYLVRIMYKNGESLIKKILIN